MLNETPGGLICPPSKFLVKLTVFSAEHTDRPAPTPKQMQAESELGKNKKATHVQEDSIGFGMKAAVRALLLATTVRSLGHGKHLSLKLASSTAS